MRLAASAVLLAGILVSLSLGVQQAQLALAREAIEHWRESPDPITAAAVGRFLAGANAWPDADGRLLAARWHAMPHDNASHVEAMRRLEEAAQLRPEWYRPWAARAVLLARIDAANPAWKDAAAEALRRGPNESRLFATLFPLWRLHWHRLDPDEQASIHDLAVRTLMREPKLVVELASRYGYLGPVCRAGREHRVARQQCDKLGFSDPSPELP